MKGVAEVVHGACFLAFQYVRDFGPCFLTRIAFRWVRRRVYITGLMPVQKCLDSARPVDRMAIENPDLAGEQERYHIDVEIGHETVCGQRALIAPLGI